MEFESFLEEIRKKLIGSYDLEDNSELNHWEFNLSGKYHLRTERYFAMKKAVVYGMENDDYFFLKHQEIFCEKDPSGILQWVRESLNRIVIPHSEHMSSTITLVIAVDSELDTKMIKEIEKIKFHQGFSWGLKGWVDLRLIVYSLKKKYFVTNKKGREVIDLFRHL